MKITDIIGESAGVGRVVPGVNMPAGMHPDEIRRQAIKFGNRVTKDGSPPVASTDGSDAVDEGRRRWHRMSWLKRLIDRSRKERKNRRRFHEEVWDEPSKKKSSKSLTPAQKAAAKARAARNGRPYPNLIDNMWASKR